MSKRTSDRKRRDSFIRKIDRRLDRYARTGDERYLLAAIDAEQVYFRAMGGQA